MSPRTGAAVAAAGVAALGGLLLGEYAFDGLAVIGAGLVLGLFVSEAAVAAIRGAGRSAGLVVTCPVLTVAGLLLAAWISTGHHLGAVGARGYLALVAGAGASALRARSPRREPGSSPESAPAR